MDGWIAAASSNHGIDWRKTNFSHLRGRMLITRTNSFWGFSDCKQPVCRKETHNGGDGSIASERASSTGNIHPCRLYTSTTVAPPPSGRRTRPHLLAAAEDTTTYMAGIRWQGWLRLPRRVRGNDAGAFGFSPRAADALLNWAALDGACKPNSSSKPNAALSSVNAPRLKFWQRAYRLPTNRASLTESVIRLGKWQEQCRQS